MTDMKRYPFLTLIYDVWGYVRGSIFIILILFVLNWESTNFIFVYGRYGFYIVTALTLPYFILKWFTYKYHLGEQGFTLRRGVFVKTEEYIPYNKVENVQKQTLLFHRIFRRTSLRFETAMSGDNARIHFSVLTREAAEEMEDIVTSYKSDAIVETETEAEASGLDSNLEEIREEPIKNVPTVHFTPKKGDLIRASFTSLSFLILIPIVFSLFDKVSDFIAIESQVEGWLNRILQSWWFIAILVSVLIIMSVIVGMIRVFIKYGKYTISSDESKIYIIQGTISEMHFSIAKKNVQAVEIKQSFLKRLLGLAEVKLISAGNVDIDDDETEINSLYPFLPIKRAYSIVEELLPDYYLEADYQRLPRRAFYYRLLKHCWFFFASSAALIYFKPSLWKIESAWLFGIILLFVYMLLTIYLNYRHSAVSIKDEMFHFKSGSLTTTEFISKRRKVVEAGVSHSFIQRRWGLITLNVTHRSNDIFNQTEMLDVPAQMKEKFLLWYMQDLNKEMLEER